MTSKIRKTFIALLAMVIFTGAIMAFGQDSNKGLPKQIPLTQVELLLIENTQLRIAELQRQQVEVLRGSLRTAGIPENLWDKYELSKDGKGFILKEEPKKEAPKK